VLFINTSTTLRGSWKKPHNYDISKQEWRVHLTRPPYK